jgi:glucoamylase
MLKVQEDRTHAGALIASLSNPWGDTVDATQSSTGYKAVWPRDFYQCAMALAALGDKETPLAAFHYLPTVQVGAEHARQQRRRRLVPAEVARRRHA